MAAPRGSIPRTTMTGRCSHGVDEFWEIAVTLGARASNWNGANPANLIQPWTGMAQEIRLACTVDGAEQDGPHSRMAEAPPGHAAEQPNMGVAGCGRVESWLPKWQVGVAALFP
jgi:hypothetical protein